MDIVTQLREGRTPGTHLRFTVSDLNIKAADEIERLRNLYNASVEDFEKELGKLIAENERLRDETLTKEQE